jgi:hypothetical protein
MIYWGMVMMLFDKMMILVAFFSWCAIGYCIMFNMTHILPFGITTNEQTVTYFHWSIFGCTAMMVISYLMAVRSWY